MMHKPKIILDVDVAVNIIMYLQHEHGSIMSGLLKNKFAPDVDFRYLNNDEKTSMLKGLPERDIEFLLEQIEP